MVVAVVVHMLVGMGVGSAPSLRNIGVTGVEVGCSQAARDISVLVTQPKQAPLLL